MKQEIKTVSVIGNVDECLKFTPVIKEYFKLLNVGDYSGDMAIIIGGDGTILDEDIKMQFADGLTPVLKIHRPAPRSLGYTIDVNETNLRTALNDIKAGNWWTIKKQMIRVRKLSNPFGEESRYVLGFALNDIGICSSLPNRNIMPRIEIYDDRLPISKVSGVVISTPYGSPAWNLSLGGGVVVENEKSAQAMMNCMLLNLRDSPLKPDHFIVPEGSDIKVQITGEVDVTIDRATYPLHDPVLAFDYGICERDHIKKIAMVKTTNTFETITQKLIRFNRYQFEQIM